MDRLYPDGDPAKWAAMNIQPIEVRGKRDPYMEALERLQRQTQGNQNDPYNRTRNISQSVSDLIRGLSGE